MELQIALIGFGEAAMAFEAEGQWGGRARVFDRKTDAAATRDGKQADYASAQVTGMDSAAEAVGGARVILSLVMADQAVAAAQSVADAISPGAFYVDGNSVSPETKREAARSIESTGAHYVDMAIMAPVHPARLDVPLLISGRSSDAAATVLRDLGFRNVTIAGPRVGEAAAIKMIRSVMSKGIEALTAECMLAASRAGVIDAVLGSFEASWGERADYNLHRMMVHGLRRAAEMEEAAKTLLQLGIEPVMTRGTVARQRQIGGLGIVPPEGLDAKLALLDHEGSKQTACR